jgi:crotonobetainyl-CoA:carnitine CoA-transferase CaiB-like acyl-CoA transferase
MTTPLADVKVLAIERFGAGPWATLQLGGLDTPAIDGLRRRGAFGSDA